MAETRLQILINAKDEASRVIASLTSKIRDAESASVGFAKIFGGAALGIGGLGIAAIEAAGNMEQANIAFATMLKSVEKGAELQKELEKFTITTPFDLRQTQELTKRLLAYGVAQKEIIPTMTVLGNLAAGVGTEKLPQLVLAYGQVRSAGRLMGTELRQFTEAGIPLLEELAKVTGMSVKDMAGNIGDLKIPFETVQKALENLTTGNGRFAGLMEAQSKTLFGAISNIRDSFYLFLTKEGNRFLDFFRDGALKLGEFIRNDLPALAEQVFQLGVVFSQNTPAVFLLAGAVAGGLAPAFLAAAGSFAAATLALAPWIAAGAAIAGVAYLIYQAYETNFYGFRDVVINTLSTISQKWTEWGPQIMATIQALVAFLLQKWTEWGPIILETTTQALAFVRQKWEEFAPLVQAAADNISKIITQVFGAIKTFLTEHGTELQAIFNGTWEAIKAIVSPALAFLKMLIETNLTLVNGVVKAALQILSGDFQGTWETIKSTAATMLDSFVKFLQGIWDGVLGDVVKFTAKMVEEFQKLPERIIEAFKQLGGMLAEAMTSAMQQALDAMIKGAQGMVDQAFRTAIQIANALNPANLFNGGGGGGGGGEIGKRASGGPVSGGTPYIVGEKGPELFIPSASGAILPNSALRPSAAGSVAGGAGTTSISFDFRGATLLSENTAKQITDLVISRLQKTSRIPSRSF